MPPVPEAVHDRIGEDAMLTIWGRSNSINVQKVLWSCGEIDLPFRRIDAGGSFGQTDTPDYRQRNPNGLVPTIEDDGFVLWESNAIVRYLATKHRAHDLFPEDLKGRFGIERWMDWHATTLWPALRPVFIGLVRTPPAERNEQVIGAGRRDTEKAFSLLDRELSGRPYIAGDAFTIGDVPIGIAAHRWFNLDMDRPPLPHVEAWFGRLGTRPAFQTHVAHVLS